MYRLVFATVLCCMTFADGNNVYVLRAPPLSLVQFGNRPSLRVTRQTPLDETRKLSESFWDLVSSFSRTSPHSMGQVAGPQGPMMQAFPQPPVTSPMQTFPQPPPLPMQTYPQPPPPPQSMYPQRRSAGEPPKTVTQAPTCCL